MRGRALLCSVFARGDHELGLGFCFLCPCRGDRGYREPLSRKNEDGKQAWSRSCCCVPLSLLPLRKTVPDSHRDTEVASQIPTFLKRCLEKSAGSSAWLALWVTVGCFIISNTAVVCDPRVTSLIVSPVTVMPSVRMDEVALFKQRVLQRSPEEGARAVPES